MPASGAGGGLTRLLGITGTTESNPLRHAAEACVRPIALIGLFTFFVNFLLFISPIYMMQVYDRVLTSSSIETLVFLTIIALFVLAVLAVFEHVRGQMLVNLGEWVDAFLSQSLFARTVQSSLSGDSYKGDRLRDLGTLRSFLGSPALTAVLDAMWTPMFIAAAFLLHPLLGFVALASAMVLFLLAWIDEVATRGPLLRAGEATSASAAHAMAAARNAELIESMGMMDVVGARWFAKYIYRAGEVEYVVNQLKGHSEVHSIVAHHRLLRWTCAAQERADFTASAKEIGGLAGNYVEVFCLGNVGAAEQRQLQQLAFGHPARDRGEDVQNR